MISNFNYYKQIENPDMYLCNPDKRLISAINATNRHLVLRFNDLSDLTFTVYKNIGKEEDYNRIETKRLLFVDKIGWFKIEAVEANSDGAQEYKSVTAKSQQCVFKDRGFYVENRVYMFYNPKDPTDSRYDSNDKSAIPSVVGQLYQQLGIKCALHLSEPTITEDYPTWTIVWVDSDLKYDLNSDDNICRSFDENTTYGYDFMINDVEKAFGVVFDFDILHHTIKVKFTENLTQKTNIYLSFDNVVNTLGLKENSENIVTVLSCNGKDLDIRTVNPMGTNYICNFDYYKKTVSEDGLIPYPWMSQSLIGALNDWETLFNSWQEDDNSRTGHTKGYSSVVLDLQELYLQETKLSEEIQRANLILLDLSHARDQLSTAAEADKDDFAILPIIVETVNTGEKSKLGANIGSSSFYNTAFQETSIITAYTSAPDLTSTGDGLDDYEYAFSGSGTTGTAKSMIQNFIDSDSDTANLTVPFYFIDDSSARSYCKLNVASVVDVAVDENGIAMQFAVGDSGSVTLNGITLTIIKESASNYTIKRGETTVASNVTSNGYFIYNGNRFRLVDSADNFVTVYYYYVSGFDRYSTYILTTGEHGWCSLWESYVVDINGDNDDLQEDINDLLDELEYINNQCNIQTYIKNRSDALYEELQYYWIEGDYDNDNLAVLDGTTMAERIELAKELMEAGEIELEKVAQPTFELSVNAIDFTKIYEFKKFTEELELGKVITIQKNDTTHYYPALLSIDLDLDAAGNFTLTFSNAFKTDETAMTIADLLNEATSTSRTVSANWSNLMSYSKNKDTINDLIRNPLDKTLRTMQANMANQEFSIDTTGILGRKYSDSSHDSFDKEQLRIINNVIMFTDDCWETSKLALGKITYTENSTDYTAYGLLAEVVVGELIMGSTLKIKNANSSIVIDGSGILIKHNTDTVFEADTDGNLTLRGTVYATSGSFSGTLISPAGTIGGFTITNKGLESDYIIINEDVIYIPSQAVLNIDNDVIISADRTNHTAYITTGGEMDFIIRNATGAGIKFNKLQETEIVEQSILITNLSISRKVSIQYDYSWYIVEEYTFTYSISNSTYLFISKTIPVYVSCIKKDDGTTFTRVFNLTIPPNTSSGSITIDAYDGLNKTATYTPKGISKTNTYIENFTVSSSTNVFGVEQFTISNCPTLTYTVVSTSATNNILYSLGSFNPDTPVSSAPDSGLLLGNSTHCWNSIYAYNPVIVVSDRREKKDILKLSDSYERFFDNLKPVSFTYKSNNSNRKHVGFIAQDVEDALLASEISTVDFAGIVISEGEEHIYSLRYEEFIALNTYEIQKLKKRVIELENKLKEIQGE